ncbi:hypothetical protein JCM10207_005078 [Rhodosporidiobolus poonsookiae]
MSCGQPTEDDALDQPIAAPSPSLRSCVRCKQSATIQVHVSAWCNDCFHRSFGSRFSRMLEPARVVCADGIKEHEGGQNEPRRRTRQEVSGGKEPGKVVLAFSGGASSRALLELFKTRAFAHLVDPADPSLAAADDADSSKKNKGKKHGLTRPAAFSACEIVFVDESGVPGFGEDRTAEVRRIVHETAPFFTFTALKLEDVFALSTSTSSAPASDTVAEPLTPFTTSFTSPSLPCSSSSPPPSSPSNLSQLHALLSPLTPTARTTLHRALLSSLLRLHARRTSAAALLLGDSATRVAIRTLEGMATGRGWSAGEDAAAHYVDRSPSYPGAGAEGEGGAPLLVVRPLALSTAKEIAYYARTVRGPDGARPLESLTMRRPETSVASAGGAAAPVELKKRGVGALVEDFILSLNVDFPQTVSTVVRTAHKLGMRSADAAYRFRTEGRGRGVGEESCAVCGSPAQPGAHEWRAAITISDLEAARRALAASSSSLPPPSPLPAAPTSGAASAASTAPRLRPYQPSAAHLLPSPSSSASSPSTDPPAAAASASVPPPEQAHAKAEGDDGEDSTPPALDLAPHLCYACLLVLQEPLSSSAVSAKTAAGGGGAGKGVPLPPYVSEAVLARLALAQEGGEVVGMREVRGEEKMRREVQGFLLEDEGEGV